MTKLIFLLTIISVLILACNKKLPFKNGDLAGYCGYEIINEDKGLLCFTSDSTFTREGDMYIEVSGSYYIKTDTLFLNYYCDNCIDKNNITKLCCGQQTYVMMHDHTLQIVGWKNNSGEIQQIPKYYQDIKLFKK